MKMRPIRNDKGLIIHYVPENWYTNAIGTFENGEYRLGVKFNGEPYKFDFEYYLGSPVGTANYTAEEVAGYGCIGVYRK